MDGILVAPGFGGRGIQGKIHAIRYVREQGIPFFGICLGMQCAVIEFARNVLELGSAHSTEMDSFSDHPVIHLMDEQEHVKSYGGTMRLGAYDCLLKPDSLAASIYNNQKVISERHRHRFEFNNSYLADFEQNGMIATGKNPPNDLVEIVEIPSHPFFVGVQFHRIQFNCSQPSPIVCGLCKGCHSIPFLIFIFTKNLFYGFFSHAINWFDSLDGARFFTCTSNE